MRGDDDVLACHRVATDLHTARVVAEFLNFRMLVYSPPERDERLRHACKIFARMDSGLVCKANAWPRYERSRFNVLCVEAQLTRQRRISAQALRLIARVATERRVQVAVHPVEVRIDAVLTDDVVDLGDGGQPRVPYCLRVGASELSHQFVDARVGHHGQVRTGVSRVGGGAAAAFEHDDAFACLREEVCGGETGDPTADDDRIGFGIAGQFGELRERGRRPVRRGDTLCGGHRDPFQRPVSACGECTGFDSGDHRCRR